MMHLLGSALLLSGHLSATLPRMRLFICLLLITTSAQAAEPSAAGLDKRRKALADVIEEQWQYNLRTSPEYASILGDKRYSDQSGDFSAAAQRRDDRQNRAFLRRAEGIETTGFSDQ